MKRNTQDTVQDETKSEPAKKWRADTTTALYDPETDLTKLALHLDDEENPGSIEKLMMEMDLLGQPAGYYEFTESLPFINQKLNSSDSALKKTGTLFILCQDLLKGLQHDQFEENFHPILFNLIYPKRMGFRLYAKSNSPCISLPIAA
jgi:hypothetical protein